MILCRWIQNSSSNINGDIFLAAHKDGIILVNSFHTKFRCVNRLIKITCPVTFSRIFVGKIFCKFVVKASVIEFFLVKFHAFSIFFWTRWDRCVWNINIVFWEASYFVYLKNSCLALQKPQKPFNLKSLSIRIHWK